MLENKIDAFYRKYFDENPNEIKTFAVNSDVVDIQEDVFKNIGEEFCSDLQNGQDCHIVFHRQPRRILENISNAVLLRRGTRRILLGPCGSGKTTTLVILSQLAKEMGILVLALNAADFNQANSPKSAFRFLKYWRDSNRESLKLMNKELVDLLADIDRKPEEFAIEVLVRVIQALMDQREKPVLFLIDQFNIFAKINEEIDANPSLLKEQPWRQIAYSFLKKPQVGVLVVACSSSFQLGSFKHQFDEMVYINPLEPDFWRELVETSMDETLAKHVTLSETDSSKVTVEQLGKHLGHLPREFRTFHRYLSKSKLNSTSTSHILDEYIEERSVFYFYQIENVFKTINDKNSADLFHLEGIQLFLKTNIRDLAEYWYSSGLVFWKNGCYHFSCPALYSGFRKFALEYQSENLVASKFKNHLQLIKEFQLKF